MDSFTLAHDFAPIIYQKIDSRKLGRDLLANFDFDGDWNFKNNISNAKKIDSGQTNCDQIVPTIYYATAETETHYYILNVIFHVYGKYPYGLTKNGGTRENDCKGILQIIEKQRNGNKLLGVAAHIPNSASGGTASSPPTMIPDLLLRKFTKSEESHTFDFFSYDHGIRSYDSKKTKEISVDVSDNLNQRIRIEINKEVHTISSADPHDSYFKRSNGLISKLKSRKNETIMYVPTQNNVPSVHNREEILRGKENTTFQYSYRLVSLLDPKLGLVSQLKNPDTFYDNRNFNLSKFGNNLVNAPWTWGYPQYSRLDNEGMPTRIWDDPAYYVHTKIMPGKNGKEFNRNYVKNMAQE